jgi:ABC-2 type transport system ATP-binding protein
MSAKEPAVIVRDLHKEFILPQHKNTSLKQTVVNITRNNGKTTQKVLDGVSFEVNKGDFFGIVGRNGSGKSTLLKILAGVYTPTSGSVEIRGGLTPFIELGVGFNPELSGRDNVFLNGALLGFSRKDMEAMYEEIVDFAELGPFMDQKLKNYSSGMQVRLAFSIAIKAHNEILIFDEVLAVGDEAFQRKCLDVFEQYKASGQTVILVTHDMETVKKFCNNAILISNGKIADRGDPRKIADEYSKLNQDEIDRELGQKGGAVSGDLWAQTRNSLGQEQRSFDIADTMELEIGWKKNPKVKTIMVDLFKLSGEHVSGFKSLSSGYSISDEQDHALAKIKLDLSPGKYYFEIAIRTDEDQDIEVLYRTAEFTIKNHWPAGRPTWSGMMPLSHEWKDDLR